MSVCDPRIDWIAVVRKRLLRVRVSGAGVFEAVSDGVPGLFRSFRSQKSLSASDAEETISRTCHVLLR